MENIGYKLASQQSENHSNLNSENNNSKNNKILIPDQTCSMHNSFLINNYDFFYKYIYDESTDNTCSKLYIHLNNCYSCFCVFSQTMRDYFHKKNEITISANGVAK